MVKKEKRDGSNSMEEIEASMKKAEEEMKGIGKMVNKESVSGNVKIKNSKPISELKKGDKIKVDRRELEIDAHYVLIDHGNTKEMAIELFDPKKDEDFQLRYFSDNVENSLEFYELEEIIYVRKELNKVEW